MAIYQAGQKTRDWIELRIETEGDRITSSQLVGVGCGEFLQAMSLWRERISGSLKNLGFPTGASHSEILIREVILKAKGEWVFPYLEKELCHCRAIPTETVDQAIIFGCHTPEAVSRQTSASTACGTCRPDVISIINYRLLNTEAKKA